MPGPGPTGGSDCLDPSKVSATIKPNMKERYQETEGESWSLTFCRMHTMIVRGVRALMVAVCLVWLVGASGTQPTAQQGASYAGGSKSAFLSRLDVPPRPTPPVR